MRTVPILYTVYLLLQINIFLFRIMYIFTSQFMVSIKIKIFFVDLKKLTLQHYFSNAFMYHIGSIIIFNMNFSNLLWLPSILSHLFYNSVDYIWIYSKHIICNLYLNNTIRRIQPRLDHNKLMVYFPNFLLSQSFAIKAQKRWCWNTL